MNSGGKEYLKARELVDLVKLELALCAELKFHNRLVEVPEIDLSPSCSRKRCIKNHRYARNSANSSE